MLKSWSGLVIAVLLTIFSATTVLAEDGPDGAAAILDAPAVMPPSAIEESLPPDLLPDLAGATLSMKREDDALHLAPDRNELIRLNQDAASVIVNNPDHASIMLDSPRLLIVVPHLPGSTSFTVLDEQGHTILQKDVIVTSVQPRHVRIRRMCSGSDASCQAESHFYCPNGCYEVTPITPQSSSARTVPPPPAASGIAASANALSGTQK